MFSLARFRHDCMKPIDVVLRVVPYKELVARVLDVREVSVSERVLKGESMYSNEPFHV